MTRQEVFALIDGEREYQMRWDAERKAKGLPTRDAYATVEAWLLWLEDYTWRARRAATDSTDKTEALANMRKIAALAVACMEYLGAPPRVTA